MFATPLGLSTAAGRSGLPVRRRAWAVAVDEILVRDLFSGHFEAVDQVA